METGKKRKKVIIHSLTEDLWALILARLTLMNIATSKLVCKQWKSILESPLLRKLFLAHHQNSHSSWSLMCRDHHLEREEPKEVVAHYGCKIWGLRRSLGSYVSSFITSKFDTNTNQNVKVLAYTEVGLILIGSKSVSGDGLTTYYVANPISRQYVEIPPPPQLPTIKSFKPSGLATRIESGATLGYKVVLVDSDKTKEGVLSLLIYSSETSLWSFKTLHSSSPFCVVYWLNPVSLSRNLYWFGLSSGHEPAIVSHDFYATGAESDRCSVIIFPKDYYWQHLRRDCTTSQGFLLYMQIWEEDNLSVWRLKSGEWEQVPEKLYPTACLKTSIGDYVPLVTNPFDGNIVYLWNDTSKCFATANLDNKGKVGIHNNLEYCSSDGRTLSFTRELSRMKVQLYLPQLLLSTFALPRWLYRIPSSPS